MTDLTSPSRSRGRQRDPERTRAAILLAAREEFTAHGFSGARTHEIAKRGGVPQGLLFHYFGSKEGLFQTVMDEALAPYFQATIELLENPPSGHADLHLLEAAIRMYFEFLRDNPHVAKLMAWWSADARWGTGMPHGLDEAMCRRPMELGSVRIREAQEAGFIRRELDPEFVIRLFLNLCMYWHQTWEATAIERGQDPADADAMDALHTTYLDHVVDVLLHGVAVPATRPPVKESRS